MKSLMLLMLMLVSAMVQAQYVHVNMYVEFSGQSRTAPSDSVVGGPWLVVQYRNNTGKQVYLPKLANPVECGYPLVSSDVMLNVARDEQERVVYKPSPNRPYADSNFMVRITPEVFSIYGEAALIWDYEQLLREKLTGKEPDANPDTELINYHIRAKINKKKRQKGCPEYTSLWKDLTLLKENPLSGLQTDIFIFMDTGAVHEDRFDLSAFVELGGSYCFVLDNSVELSAGGVIYYNKYFSVRQIYRYSNVAFPENINGFEFYDGQIYANSTQVRFSRAYSQEQ